MHLPLGTVIRSNKQIRLGVYLIPEKSHFVVIGIYSTVYKTIVYDIVPGGGKQYIPYRGFKTVIYEAELEKFDIISKIVSEIQIEKLESKIEDTTPIFGYIPKHIVDKYVGCIRINDILTDRKKDLKVKSINRSSSNNLTTYLFELIDIKDNCKYEVSVGTLYVCLFKFYGDSKSLILNFKLEYFWKYFKIKKKIRH